MRYGLTTFLTPATIQPGEFAREAEIRGFSSLLLPEHTHIPKSRETPWGGGSELPGHYSRILDPFVALAMAATTTRAIRIGTGICLVAERDPIVLAKAVSTLDTISQGRMIFGIGHGWNREELRNHGVDFSARRAIVAERISLMKTLWTKQIAEHQGVHHNITPSWQWPKPIQSPHPPILLGASPGTRTFQEVVEYADGWLPVEGRHDISRGVKALRRVAEDRNRDPDTLKIVVFQARGDQGLLDQYERLGADEVLFFIEPAERDQMLDALDQYTSTVDSRH